MATERERKYTQGEGGRLLLRVEVDPVLAADLPAKQVEASALLAEELDLQKQVDDLTDRLRRRRSLPKLLDEALDKGVPAPLLEARLQELIAANTMPNVEALAKAQAIDGDPWERKLILPAEEEAEAKAP